MKKYIMLLAAILSTQAVMAENGLKGYDKSNMDLNVKPGDDFVQYATGEWIKNHPLRDDQECNSAFIYLIEDNQKRINDLILQFANSKPEKGTLGQKIGSLYNMMMDTERLNREGFEPIKKDLEKVRNLNERKDLQKFLAQLSLNGTNAKMFHIGAGPDNHQADQNIVIIAQGGLGLGIKDYYVNDDEQSLKVREAYKTLRTKLFELVGYDTETAKAKTEAVFAIENRLAGPTYSQVQLRDVDGTYHKMTYKELKAQFPGIDWDTIFKEEGYPEFEYVNVMQPEPIHEVEKIYAETPLEDIKSYIESRIIGFATSVLSEDFEKADFEFEKVLSGQLEDDPRWKKATNLVNSLLDEPIGQMYCEKYFPESSKAKMKHLVRNLQAALGERIQSTEWMTLATKAEALHKLAAFTIKIGYPDKWKDYTGLVVDESLSLYENLCNICKFFKLDDIKRNVNKPVDKDEWGLSPQTINAYYNPTNNEICFPAGILQPPFFDPEADDAINYGAIGVVIGHEMSHGFDDQGSLFDLVGNRNNWWKPEDKKAYEEHTKVLEEHFSNLEVAEGKKVNGKLTLGENIGDNGGLNIALLAFHKTGNNEIIDGLSADQRFFLSYARLWASNVRPEFLDRQLKMDVHSPFAARVNGALPHIDGWYDAFDIKEGDKMFIEKDKRAKIW